MKNRTQLRDEYARYGIDFVYNDRQRKIYLKIKGAPLFAEGVVSSEPGAQLTGWYSFYGGIKDAQDVAFLSQRAKELYREQYADNPDMLKYLGPDAGSELNGLFVFGDELCVQDKKHECIDGYLLATDGLVSRLREALTPALPEEARSTLENINFYSLYHVVSGQLELLGTYWCFEEDGGLVLEKHGSVELPLNDRERKALLDSMEAYCQENYHMSCFGFLNDARREVGLPELQKDGDRPACGKLSLAEQISAAEGKLPTDLLSSPPVLGAPER